MKFRKCLLALLAFPAFLCGTDLKPWLTPDLEFQYHVTELLQYYRNIDTPHKRYRRHELDSFTTFGLQLAGFDYSGELEVTLADTKRQTHCCDNIRFTARYLLLDDNLGDIVSAVAGVTVTQAFKNSLRDPSSFHHGILEAEAHLSVGRQMICLDNWKSRWWGVAGFGSGDHGSPWLHGYLAWEYNYQDLRRFRLFAETLWGLGRNNFSYPFRGYGSIRHQSVDVGVRFTHVFESYAKLSFQYSYRVYARNFPVNASRILFKFEYPFCYIFPFIGRNFLDGTDNCDRGDGFLY